MVNTTNSKPSASARWASKCSIEGYACVVCGNDPLYDERDIFFETGCCGAHAAQAEKALDE
ncbi:hypothetical protein [Methylopila sp. 73B]|uniref:hypothetical protein n=1 Tax=Methylopila sp. 73B TaxID=1120792 RepID=UPI0012DE7D3F|nr:hypothetical protein [Methylopila sp. 73B]